MILDLEQNRALFEHAPTMIWRARLDGQYDYFSASWLAFTGRVLEQEVGLGWTRGLHPEDLPGWFVAARDHIEAQKPFEMRFRLRRLDGLFRWVIHRGAPYQDAAGSVAGFIGTCVDVDERDARDVLAGANDFFEMSLDNLCVAGLDGYFRRVNPSWTRTLGWTTEELLSRPSVEFVHPEDRETTLAGRQRLRTGSSMGPLVNRYLCKDGTHRWFEWRSVAQTDRGLVYAAARDVTEQKLAEESLRQAKELQEKLQRQLLFADRMASVGTLASGVAHEINNPLASVMGNLALILEDIVSLASESPSEKLAELEEMAREAREGGERIRKIVGGLQTFSRAEEERLAVVAVQPVLDRSVDMTFNEIRHRARLVKAYGPTPLVEADEARLGQVFVNLLVNAAQALPEGEVAANEIRIATSTDEGGRAVIEVRDTGRGIPAAILDRIFDPFFTTKPVGIGTGLGLSICHNIVTSMSGSITASSEEGRGTTFRVVLPPALAVSDQVAAAASPVKKSATRAAVLVIDDEPSVGAVLRRVLRDHEVTVVTAARAALELLGSGKRFDIILSDLMMPEMSGMDFYDELALRFPEVSERVVFISGGAFTPVANEFLDRVTNQRIEKPFDPQSVRDIVRRFASTS